MAKLYSITDYLNYEKDEFSLVDEQIVVWREAYNEYHQFIGKEINEIKTKEKASDWVRRNVGELKSEADIEEYADTIMVWIKDYYDAE